MALLAVPAGAAATSPVLEFVVPSGQTVHFTTESEDVIAEMAEFDSIVHCAASEGQGEITGPDSAVAEYKFTKCVTEKGTHAGAKCTSLNAKPEEIVTGSIDAKLVYVDRASNQVGILLNPSGGVYMSFTCGGEAVEAKGAFLAPVSPLNQAVSSFTATLSNAGSMQTPDVYENENGELVPAIPVGNRPSHEFVPTSVAATMTIRTSVPVEIKSVTPQEIEAKQREEAQTKYQEEVKQKEAAVNKRHDEEAAASKKHEEELKAQLASVEGQLKELLAKQQAGEKHPPTRAQLLAKALKQCKKQPKRKRAKCRATAEKRYGDKVGKKGK